MKLIDYIFYRLYTVYEKHGDSGRFSTCTLFMYVSQISLVFILRYIAFFWKNEHWYQYLIYWKTVVCLVAGTIVFNILFVYTRYRKKRIEKLRKQFRGNPWNKIIPAWCFYLSPFFFMIGGGIIWWLLEKYYG